MKYSLKTKTFLSLIFLGFFVFINLFLVNNFCNAVTSIGGTNATSSDQFPHNGTTTLASSVSFGVGTVSTPKIIGIDGGDLTIATGKTLQLGNYNIFVVNPGNKIINQKGYIVKNSASNVLIVHGYLWAKDLDGDSCFDPSNIKYNNSPTTADTSWTDYAKYKRVKNLTYVDTDDSNAGNGAVGSECTAPLTLTASLSASTTSGTAPLSVTLTATVGGTATGNTRYRFDYASDGYDTDDTVSATTYSKTYTYTTAGTHTAKVEVTRGGITTSATVDITVTAQAFDFSLGVSPTSFNVVKPTSSTTATTTVSATLTSGTSQTVSFSLSTLPTGVTASALNNCTTLPCSQVLTFTITSAAALSSNSITITAMGGTKTKTATFTLNICQCTIGACCDGCSYRASTYQCSSVEQYRCSGTSCGSDVQSRSAPKYCSGSSESCSGSTGSYSSWVTEQNCPTTMKCDSSDYSCTSEGCACSCTSWVNGSCNWFLGCMNQTRTCTPSGCDTTSRCTSNSSCTCTNECSPSGTIICIFDNIATCGNYDSDGCLESRITTYCGWKYNITLCPNSRNHTAYYYCVAGRTTCQLQQPVQCQ